MQPDEFVTSLKNVARKSVAGTLDYIADPPVPEPPGHLGEFSRWWQGLTDPQRRVARQVLEFVAEGSLFHLLSLLDGVSSLAGHKGAFELFHVVGGARTRLNDPDADTLSDLFNNTA